MKQDVLLPKLGESIHSARVIKWLKQPGDTVRRDEPLLEVSTDKVASEIPAPSAGIVGEILCQEGEECQVGEILCSIVSEEIREKKTLSPAVLRLVEEKGLCLEEIQKMQGSGDGGRITKQDIENLSTPKESKTSLSFVRRAIADNMERSHREIPLAHLITKVDVTDLLGKIAEEKGHFQEKYGCKLTITAPIVYHLSRTLQQFPLLHARFTKEGIIKNEHVGLGIAVHVDGDLFVPVIPKCETLSLSEIAQALAHLSSKVKQKNLTASDIEGGTITLSNFGMSGIEIGLPLVRHPETAILAVGAIEKRVEVLKDESYGVRSIIYVTLGFDHRVLDGMLAATFLKTLKDNLEHPL